MPGLDWCGFVCWEGLVGPQALLQTLPVVGEQASRLVSSGSKGGA